MGFASRRLVILLPLVASGVAAAQALSKAEAVTLAERFIAENGYTNRPRAEVKKVLDPESLEWEQDRNKILASRFDSLASKAIGVKRGDHGWSVAFDYRGARGDAKTCRVITMAPDGTRIRVQHQDGLRSYFAGFE